MPIPTHIPWTEKTNQLYTLSGEIEKNSEADFIVIDTPGTNSNLTKQAIELADTLITPLNDSLIDLDVLATLDQETLKIKGPSHFSQTVWGSRQQRMLKKRPSLNWIIVRNRLIYTKSKNSTLMSELLTSLSRRIHFSIADGISERVIYRELFIKGLTMMDLKENGLNMPLSFSSLTARQEIRSLVNKILHNPLQ